MTKPGKPGSLKQACKRLVDCCGGLKVAAALWGCKSQNVSRMLDDDHAQNPPRVDQVALLEARCGQPIVSTFLAAQLNCVVEPITCRSGEPLALVMGRITKETGEMLSAASLAVTAGRLTPTNAANVLRETDDVVCALVELRAQCREVLAQVAA